MATLQQACDIVQLGTGARDYRRLALMSQVMCMDMQLKQRMREPAALQGAAMRLLTHSLALRALLPACEQ